MCYKQMQKTDAHLPTDIRDKSKQHFSIMKTHFYVYLVPSNATLYNFFNILLFAYPLKYEAPKYLTYKYTLQIKTHPLYYPI